jgi:hypothetical protein
MNRASSNSGTLAANRERRVRVPERIRRAMLEPGRPDSRGPDVAAPVVQVQVAATVAGEQQRGVEPRRQPVERHSGSGGQRDGPERTGLLPVQLHLPVGVDAANMDDARADVTTLQRDPLFGP